MSKILNLPTSKDTNWGGTLNSYLEQLNNRIENLEIERQEVTDKYNSIANIGYASTGLVGGNNEITYNEDKEEIKFKGSVYISGGINRYFKIEDYVKRDLSTLDTKICYFILLGYNESTGFEIISSPVEDFDYTKILLGFYYNNKFVKYYYSSLKNVVQHQYELNNSWIDLDTNQNSIVVTLGNNNVTANISNKYRLYCGGIGDSSLINIMSTSNYIDIEPNGNIIYLLDEVKAEDSNKISTVRGASSNVDLTVDKGNYYRMLLDIFGNIYIQKSIINTRIEIESTSWSTQQLYNAKFNNNIPEITASLWVEVARFGFNGNFFKIYSSYVYQQFDTAYNEDFIFVKALDRGVINQQAANIWLTQDSEIRLNKITFKNNAGSSHSFNFNYIDSNNLNEIINIDGSIASSGRPTILWTRTKDENSIISLETDISGIILKNSSPNEDIGIEINSDKDINIESKKNIKLKLDEFCITNGLEDFIKYTNDGGSELSFFSTKLQEINPYVLYTTIHDDLYSTLNLKQGDKKITLDLSPNKPSLNIEAVDTYTSNIYLKDGSEIKFTSDRRRKENFAPIKDSYLDIVLNTPVLNYNYKGSKKQQVGIIAQDLENAVKNNIDCFVSKEDTIELKDKRSLNETKLIYILWKSIQEQNDYIQKLEKRLNDLERNL